MEKLKIGNFEFGSRTFIIAEISANHGGRLQSAVDLIRAAKRAGADAVKLQTYSPGSITLDCNKLDFMINQDSPWTSYGTLWNLYQEAYTPYEWYETLFQEARCNGIEIFSSVFDEFAVDFMETLNTPAYKVASPEITHIPLLEKIAATRKPVILSCGLADLEDITLAVETLRTYGSEDIILLKCTSAYPAPIEEVNLSTMVELGKRFSVRVGLSDHTTSPMAAYAAVALGASVIEKHIVLSGDRTVDSFFSANDAEFSRMTEGIRRIEKTLGTVCFEISPSSLKNFNGRRSIYVSKTINEGDIITEENIKIVRPAFGLHPKFKRIVMGRAVNKRLELGDRLSLDDIE